MTVLTSAKAFEESDAARLLTNSVQYLAMASLVIESEKFKQNPRKYNRPILNTLATGIELLMKFSHVQHGASVDEIASRYRHNIWRLWRECPEPTLVDLMLQVAKQSYADALAQSIVEPIDDVLDEFRRALRNLSKLHSAGGSQLRYLAPPNVKATAPGWLNQTFYNVAEVCLRRPPFGP